MDALSISYSGESEATLWIENSVLTLSLDTETEFDLSDTTLGELSLALNLVDGIISNLIADADMEASELNEVSMAYPADIKSEPYFLGQENYSSPKKVSEVSHKNAHEIRNSWLDEADALIESITGLIFRARSIESISIDINSKDVFSADDYGICCSSKGIYLKRYAPISSLDTLKIEGVPVTTSTVVADYDRLILTSDSEISSWPIGRSKAEISLSYGYPKSSRESILASEFATLYVSNKLFESDLRLRQKSGATKVTHASVVFENDTSSEETLSRKEIELRMEMILEHLPKKIRGVLG